MRNALRNFLLYGDHLAILLYLGLLVTGNIMIRSATFGTKYAPLASRQMIWTGLAVGLFFLAVLIPYEIWLEYSYFIYIASIASLLAVLVIGHAVAGSRSWLYIGPLGFQPSEFAKVAAARASAAYIKGLPDKNVGVREMLVLAAIIGLPAALTFLQPDFGTATTFLPLGAAAFYFSKMPLTRILKWMGAGTVLLLVLFAIGWFTFFKPYQKERVLTFLNPSLDPRGAGYQVNQARIAVGSGELTGEGLYSGTQNRLNFLPAPHTDFIFGVVAEETGFLGSVAVLLAFFGLLSRFVVTIRDARDAEGRFLVLAALAVILYHVIINVGMVIGLLPTTGIPLPFLSYGGSFLMSMSLFVGLAVNVRTRRFAQ